jgi:hypothetical protein
MVETKQNEKKQKRMDWADYAVIHARQTLAATGDTRPTPENWIDLHERFKEWSLRDAAFTAAQELFGAYPYEEGKAPLYKVESLTLKESAIAVRMDLTHAEKIEMIKPLRDKRRADADARELRPYRLSKWEREYLENKRRWEAEREEQITSAVAESTVVSAEDRAWAAEMGLLLD